MRRRSFLAGLFAVPVAVACEPVRGVSLVRPGSSGGAAVAGQAEDWHYVGGTGEPAFENSWDNQNASKNTLAFRIRESGMVDIQGIVEGGANGTVVFTLPEGYRPSGWGTRIDALGGDTAPATVYEPVLITIGSSGVVTAYWTSGGSTTVLFIADEFFLNPPT